MNNAQTMSQFLLWFGIKADWSGDIAAPYREKARHPDAGGAYNLNKKCRTTARNTGRITNVQIVKTKEIWSFGISLGGSLISDYPRAHSSRPHRLVLPSASVPHQSRNRLLNRVIRHLGDQLNEPRPFLALGVDKGLRHGRLHSSLLLAKTASLKI